MRRVLAWVGVTGAALGLLLSYPTSTHGRIGSSAQAAGIQQAAPVGVVPAAPGPVHVAAPARKVPAAVRHPAATRTSAARPSAAAPAARRSQSAPQPQAVQPKAAPKPAPKPTPAKTVAPTRRTINGAVVDTQYGPIQVQITMTGSHIDSSNAIVYPRDTSRGQQINDSAIPQLNDETVQAQSASIDTVSGATYTSDGYRQSLQSALDAAKA